MLESAEQPPRREAPGLIPGQLEELAQLDGASVDQLWEGNGRVICLNIIFKQSESLCNNRIHGDTRLQKLLREF